MVREELWANLWKMLATDLDKDTSDEDRVALMTIHLAKGLEFHVLLWYGRRFISICDEYEYTI
jgi:superfamily I DNA/RNA helicase